MAEVLPVEIPLAEFAASEKQADELPAIETLLVELPAAEPLVEWGLTHATPVAASYSATVIRRPASASKQALDRSLQTFSLALSAHAPPRA